MTKTPKEMVVEILNKGQLSQQELAERIGVSPAQITRWLASAQPKLKHFQKLEEIYKEIAVQNAL